MMRRWPSTFGARQPAEARRLADRAWAGLGWAGPCLQQKAQAFDEPLSWHSPIGDGLVLEDGKLDRNPRAGREEQGEHGLLLQVGVGDLPQDPFGRDGCGSQHWDKRDALVDRSRDLVANESPISISKSCQTGILAPVRCVANFSTYSRSERL
jgi:hypothetical protein